MNARMVERPEADEIPSHYVGYIKRVPELDPVIVGAAQIEDTATLRPSRRCGTNHGISRAADRPRRHHATARIR